MREIPEARPRRSSSPAGDIRRAACDGLTTHAAKDRGPDRICLTAGTAQQRLPHCGVAQPRLCLTAGMPSCAGGGAPPPFASLSAGPSGCVGARAGFASLRGCPARSGGGALTPVCLTRRGGPFYPTAFRTLLPKSVLPRGRVHYSIYSARIPVRRINDAWRATD